MFSIIFWVLTLLSLALFGSAAYLVVRALLKKFNRSQGIDMSAQEPLAVATAKGTALKNTTLLKALTIGILSILALIPLGIIMDMTSDRQALYHSVVDEIGRSWGEQQTLSGPALVIPYSYFVLQEEVSNDGKTRHEVKRTYQDELVILPKKLTLDLDLKHDFRTRGIYQSLVYNAALQGQADFSLNRYDIPNLIAFDNKNARLVFGVSSNQAIDKVEKIEITGESTLLSGSLMSGTGLTTGGLEKGFNQKIQVSEASDFSVDFAMTLRGSQSISALPLGEQTLINIRADWPHPSFKGLLPAERDINAQGFTASWNISHLTRNYPQEFIKSNQSTLTEVSANAILFEPVTHYGKIDRSVKYGLLFIVLTFIMLFIFEIGQKTSLSTIQYVLVGSAMALFYLLLLSLSEHLAFLHAYLIAACIPVLSVSAYVGSATASIKRGALVGIMLVSLYAVLYSILQLEDYALLMGSGLLLVVLLILMFVTRHHPKNTAQ
ncbi:MULTISPECIES: cell envelope integrity protein CreD [unclassified Shewanella]|jgi:inner membrane protein|uniref:cell envelope integrity protein CreD n=1 Tax=Shewanella TaxID=22 RepID=UPI001C5B832F|nr:MULTISPECIES: cell envelope integrity protein CreD [unclassified Shewanella]MBW3516218.1 cell envelope integrity protein CreD [Shewanella sp. NKUCC01_JLK]MCU8044893.1 cell envelope integrity protein CreD [Shewanella sp. SM68]MCU8049179.1 cell envelope integrity protein CreD [Shewanella sp. SM65]MCU8106956.1 cell envelope integrity protein CreD [Shewanella sp. SM101]